MDDGDSHSVIVLAIDTATTNVIAGLVTTSDSDGGIDTLAEAVIETRSHNEELVPLVNRLLAQTGLQFADIDAVVAGCGPGPFTGLRVGMASAVAFGQALGKPVYGVVTHDAVASLIDAPDVLIATDARRKEVYWARYRGGHRVEGPNVIAPGDLDVGDVDVVSVPDFLASQLNTSQATRVCYVAPRPAGLVAVADLSASPAPLVPHYLRRPDAQVPALKSKSAAIPNIDVGQL